MKPKSYRRKSTRKSAGTAALAEAEAHAALVLQQILHELPHLLAVAVLDVQSGRSLGAHSNSAAIDPVRAGAYTAEMVRQKQKALRAQHLGTEHVEGVLTTLTSQVHLLQPLGNGTQFIYLIVNKHDTNPAIVRMVLRRLAEALPHRVADVLS